MKKPRMGLLLASTVAIVFILGYLLNQTFSVDSDSGASPVTADEATPTPVPNTDAAPPTKESQPEGSQDKTTEAKTTTENEVLAKNKKQSLPADPSTAGSMDAPLTIHPEFQKVIAAATAAIPSKEDLKKLSAEQVHFTPASVQKAAIAIGDVAQSVHDHAEFAKEGVQFYRGCAENPGFPDSIAATCAAKFQELISKSPDLRMKRPLKLSPTVERLAKKIAE